MKKIKSILKIENLANFVKKTFVSNDKKYRNHAHKTGKSRGAAHNKCKLLYQDPQHIPLIFHNLSCCDAHLFVKNLGKTPER